MKRRQFILSTSMVALAPALSLSSCRSDSSLPIIDTHQHLWDLNMFPLRWVKPPLNKNFLMQDYLNAVKGQGVEKTVYMEVDVPPEYRQKEAQWALGLCKDPGNPMAGAVIRADPKSPDFEAYIRHLAENPFLKGIRYTFRDKKEIHLPLVIQNLNLLGELGLSCDLNLKPEDLSLGVSLSEKCKNTRFVLNHCGGADPIAFLSQEKEMPREPRHNRDLWYSELKKLSKQENIICKISGIVDNAGNYPLTASDLAPIIDHCIDSFGPDRVIFASDYPVCLKNMPLAAWIEILKKIVSKRPLTVQKKLFYDNAAAFYKL